MMEKLFNLQTDMCVLKMYANGTSFLEDFKYEEFDVVIMDISMPGKNGIECIADAKPQRAHVQFIVSTSLENHSYIFDALCAGATGYLLKSDRSIDLVESVREVMHGGSPMSPQIARLVVNSFQKYSLKAEVANELSDRETEIIGYLSQGLNYKQISEKLFISPHTVRTHVRNIYEKLQVKSKTEAINKIFPRA